MADDRVRVLVVDDDPLVHRLIEKALDTPQFMVRCIGNGHEALRVAADYCPQLVLQDIQLEGMDGFETCQALKSAFPQYHMQIIMISSLSSYEQRRRAFECGADGYFIKPLDPQELYFRVQTHCRLREALNHLASVRGEIQDSHQAMKRIADERTQQIIATQDVAVFTLAKVAESRDMETGNHLIRMRAYSQLLAEQLRAGGCAEIDDYFLDDLYRSSPLHDIGKVGICDAVLLKRGPLNPEEFETMKRHTIIGANILDQAVFHSSGGSFLAMAAIIARFHHERFDGQGYPAGLEGAEIPLPARIVALADVYDALTSTRPYKRAYSPPSARAMIENESGRHFDPIVVDAFTRRFDDFVEVQEKYKDLEQVTVGAISFLEHDEFFAHDPVPVIADVGE